MGRQSAIVSLCVTLAAFTAVTARAQSPVGWWEIGTSPGFSSGTYETGTATDVMHTPLTIRRLFVDGDVAVVFPFLCVWGDADVTFVEGVPIPTQPRTRGELRRTGSGGRAATPSESPQSSGSCGMGDVVVLGRYYVLDQRGWMPTIALRGHVKLPTANVERGLGTGVPDEGIGVEMSRSVAGDFVLMVDGGYTVIGDPNDFDLANRWWYDVGIGRSLAGGRVNVSAFLEEFAAIVPGHVDAQDIAVAVTLTGQSGWRIQALTEFGLSAGAPDHGLTVGVSRRF